MIDRINAFLRQDIAEKVTFEAGINKVKELFQDTDHEKV